jgi:hypothetical protein
LEVFLYLILKEAKMKKTLCAVMAMGALFIGSVVESDATSFADVAFLVDQSGSMRGEFNWIGDSITTINNALVAGGVTANYGIAGYERLAGFADSRNVWQDLTSDINQVVNAVDSASVYGGTERGYHAAEWSADNFGWSGGNYAKVLILITDERNDDRANYSYGGLFGEPALGKMIDDNNILFNVITQTTFWNVWDDAVYTKGTYQGLFDLNFLRTNPGDFTDAFTAAKLQEIQDFNPIPEVPEPTTMLLFGTGLAGLAAIGRRRGKK